ncbi:hypothetical protein CPT_Madawaska_092 [Staphylococcus phage Madawaska]|nr:hypothetical protein CPT_Madawaska_092 [Staphylococcus phage Madawaska]UAJ16931.1 hypothetical protein UFVDC4_00003 [Staphylococcus phage vB_SauM-UFV_DC4]
MNSDIRIDRSGLYIQSNEKQMKGQIKIIEENKKLKDFIIGIKNNGGYDEKELNKIVNEIVKENLK